MERSAQGYRGLSFVSNIFQVIAALRIRGVKIVAFDWEVRHLTCSFEMNPSR